MFGALLARRVLSFIVVAVHLVCSLHKIAACGSAQAVDGRLPLKLLLVTPSDRTAKTDNGNAPKTAGQDPAVFDRSTTCTVCIASVLQGMHSVGLPAAQPATLSSSGEDVQSATGF